MDTKKSVPMPEALRSAISARVFLVFRSLQANADMVLNNQLATASSLCSFHNLISPNEHISFKDFHNFLNYVH